jgi:hypothetical protein
MILETEKKENAKLIPCGAGNSSSKKEKQNSHTGLLETSPRRGVPTKRSS